MYNKQQIIETLNNEDLFIDNFLLEAFIKNWKIEPIYEDAQGVEFFDDMALEKVRNGIKQKQPKCEINIIDKDDITPVDMSVEISAYEPVVACDEKDDLEIKKDEFVEENIQENVSENFEQCQDGVEVKEGISVESLPAIVMNEVHKEVENELQNVTLDISNQTLAVLAESIARKITNDVSDFIKKTDFIEDAVQLGEYKKDNQLLIEKIDELIADNKILVKRIEELEKSNRSFVKLFGNIYIKNP